MIVVITIIGKRKDYLGSTVRIGKVATAEKVMATLSFCLYSPNAVVRGWSVPIVGGTRSMPARFKR